MIYGSLFSGIGGLDLAVELAIPDAHASWMCEADPYCRAVLRKHWPKVPIYDDIRTLTNPPSVDMLIGGFPCQDVSSVGKRVGVEKGARSGLWREYERLIRELRPRVVFVENVHGLVGRGLDIVLASLARLGYDAEWSCLRASDVGAPHERRRVFILAALADADLRAIREQSRRGESERAGTPISEHDRKRLAVDLANADRPCRTHAQERSRESDVGGDAAPVADANDGSVVAPGDGAEELDSDRALRHDALRRHAFPPPPDDADAWGRYAGAMPGIRRDAYGPAHGLDARRRRRRLKHLGNAVVPQQAAAAFRALLGRLIT